MNEIVFGTVQKKKKHFLLYILAQRDFLSQDAGQKGTVSLRILAVHAHCTVLQWDYLA